MAQHIKLDSQITFLSTIDLDKTTRFYQETLGLTLTLDQGGCRIFRVAENAYVGFCQKDEMPPTQGIIITLVTPEVDHYCDLLKEKGVVLEREPVFNADYNIYHCFLRDPNGYLVEIQRFEDPDWEENINENS